MQVDGGRKIIADYAKAKTQAPDDGFVKEAWERSERVETELGAIISKLAAQ